MWNYFFFLPNSFKVKFCLKADGKGKLPNSLSKFCSFKNWMFCCIVCRQEHWSLLFSWQTAGCLCSHCCHSGATYIHGTLQQAFWLQCCRSHLTISETLNTCSAMWLTSLGKPFVFCRIYSNSHWGDFQTRIFGYVHCWTWEIQKSHRELVTSCWDSDSLIDSSDFFHQILKSESWKYCFKQVVVSKRFCSVASSLLQSGFVYSLQNIFLIFCGMYRGGVILGSSYECLLCIISFIIYIKCFK